MANSLRTYLKDLDKELLRVRKEVDPATQVGDLVSQSDGPILFEAVKGYPGWKICDRLVSSRKTEAIALRTTPDRVLQDLAERFNRGPGESVLEKNAPVKEKVFEGGDVDLSTIPFCVHSPKDGGPYIGSGMCVVRDPETGAQNVSMHRIHVKGKNRAAVHIFSPHSRRIIAQYHGKGKPAPMAVVIGHHPCFEIATNYFGPHDVFSEHELAGSLLGEPISLVQCETSEVTVPGEAEIVIEGELVPGVMEDEGPFCEFHNYYTAGVAPKPALDVKAITMRGDALFRHLNATPYTDHQRLVAIPAEARLYDQLKRKGIDVRDVFMPPWGGLFLVIIKLVPKIDEEVREALLTALYSPVLLFSKVVVAVDEDIDVYDSQDIIYSLAVRVNPSADVLTLGGTMGLPYDLSLPEMPGAAPLRVGSKLGINATKPPLAKKDLRAKMERMSPKGWGRVSLKDFT